MSKVPDGYLRRPSGKGFLAPHSALHLVDAVEALAGSEVAEDVCKTAQMFRSPTASEPIREEKVARLFQVLRKDQPEIAAKVARTAGRKSAEDFIANQFSARGRSMLAGAPWPIAAWLLGRWATQNSWVFAGSAGFNVVSAMEFEITDNPLIRGETAEAPLCDWHAALFGQMFRRLVDPRLVCRELTCAAMGAESCRFAFYLGTDVIPQSEDAEAEPHLHAPDAPPRDG